MTSTSPKETEGSSGVREPESGGQQTALPPAAEPPEGGRRETALLPGAVVGRDWMRVPSDRPESRSPREWEEGLWGLDAAVRAAIRGGWTDDEIRGEVATLVRSH